jgi:hypothetical protein
MLAAQLGTYVQSSQEVFWRDFRRFLLQILIML